MVSVVKRLTRPTVTRICAGSNPVTHPNSDDSFSMKTFREHNPEMASQWHPTLNGDLTPDAVSFGSRRKAWWKCPEGHEWQTEIASRRNGSECPQCRIIAARKEALDNYEILSKHPEILTSATTPIEQNASLVVKREWKCENGHIWQASIKSRINGSSCPFCSGRKPVVGENDFLTTHPVLAKMWDDTSRKPESVFSHSSVKVAFSCAQGHHWVEPVRLLTRRSGCPECLASYNKPSLQDTDPSIAILQIDDDVRVSRGSEEIVEWRCGQGVDHSFSMRVYNRVRRPESYCKICDYDKFISAKERTLFTALNQMTEDVCLQGDYSLIGRELDIYIPARKIAVEFNGLYWHSEKFKSRAYHYEKWKACREKGVTLFQIWEDDWDGNKTIVLRMLAEKIGARKTLDTSLLKAFEPSMVETVGARKLRLETVTKNEARVFLDANHIQGYASGTVYIAGRDTTGIIRALLVVKRTNADGAWRIERFATRGNIPGGFTRLLGFAEKHIQQNSRFPLNYWITFSDNAVSNGNLYASTGFFVDKELGADYTYLVDNRRVHKFNYRLKRFREDATLTWEAGLTEKQLAEQNGLLRVWDAGKIRWRKNINTS